MLPRASEGWTVQTELHKFPNPRAKNQSSGVYAFPLYFIQLQTHTPHVPTRALNNWLLFGSYGF